MAKNFVVLARVPGTNDEFGTLMQIWIGSTILCSIRKQNN